MVDTYVGMFEYVAAKAGVGPTGSLSLDQFTTIVEQELFGQGDAGFSRVVRPTIAAIVGLCDVDGDWQVTITGYHKWMEAVGVDLLNDGPFTVLVEA